MTTIEDKILESLLGLLATSDSIPYTDEGVSMIRDSLFKAVSKQRFKRSGTITRKSRYKMPKIVRKGKWSYIIKKNMKQHKRKYRANKDIKTTRNIKCNIISQRS